MPTMFRCEGFSLYDGVPVYKEFMVIAEGLYCGPIGEGKRLETFYRRKDAFGLDFVSPTKESAYAVFLKRVEILFARTEAKLYSLREQRDMATKLNWEGKPHILFLPTPEQTARTAYAIKMRLAIERELTPEQVAQDLKSLLRLYIPTEGDLT